MENKDGGKLGLVACIAILTGGCIGSAIFSLSGMTMYYAGPAAIITWIVAAIILGCYGVQVAELSVRYPHSGGVYVFPAKSLGKFWGYLAAWGYIISNFIAVAFSAIYVATYLGVGFEALSGLQIPLALASILFCVILNLRKITDAGKFNNILVGLLIITMLAFGIIALTHDNFNWGNYANFFDGGMGKTGWIQAIPNAMVAYGSVVAIAFMVGQVKDPNRTVPKSMAIALIIVVALYLLMIIGTMGHITTQFLVENPGMRFIPMFAAAWTSMTNVPWLSKLISISAFLALITTMLVVQNLNALTIQAMAEDGALPKAFAKTNKNGAPSVGIIVSAVIAAALSCQPSWTELLVNLGSIAAAFTIVIVCYSLIKSRQQIPYIEGNYKAPGGNALSWITIIVIVASYIPAIFNGGAQMWIFTAIIYIVGILIYFLYSKKHLAE